MSQTLSNMIENTLSKIKDMISVNDVVGTPITTAEGVTIIPISKVSFGFASGGTDFNSKNKPENKPNNFGGGAGAGVTIAPVGFLVIKDGNVRSLSIATPADSALDRLVDMLPGVMDQVKGYFDNKKDMMDIAD